MRLVDASDLATGDNPVEVPERDDFTLTGADTDASLLQTEQAVVGTAIGSTTGASAMAEIVTDTTWFFRQAHALIFGTATRLAEAGEPVDPTTVLHALVTSGDLHATGGAAYLHTCYAAAGVNAKWHAGRVRDAGRQRHLTAQLRHALQVAESVGFNPRTGFDEVRSLVDEATTVPDTNDVREWRILLQDTLDQANSPKTRGVSFPWRDLNDLLIGLTPGQLVIVGARPGMGKSIIGAQIAAHVAIELGLPALVVSAEMSAEEITARVICRYAKVNLRSFLAHELTDDDWARISKVYQEISPATIVVDDSSSVSVAQVRTKLRGMARTTPAAVAVVDYAQLLVPGGGSRAETREREVAEISKALKVTAREFQVPVVLLAQLNRNAEMRSDKRPLLADLRESGSLEADADVVILLHREDAYDRESPRAGEIDLIVAKNRQGPVSTVTAAFQGHYGRVMDLTGDHGPGSVWSPSAALGGAR